MTSNCKNHIWKYSMKENIAGEEIQYRTCPNCKRKQIHKKDILGNNIGWQDV